MSLSIGRIESRKFKLVVMYVASLVFTLGGVSFVAPQFFGQVAYAAGLQLQVSETGTDTGTCISASCLTIGYAVNQASDNDTINVAAGDYVITENILVDRALTIIGANATVNPNTGARGTETVLRGDTVTGLSRMLEINSQNVVIKGITFNNLRIDNYNNTTGINAKLIGGITIENNIFSNGVGTAIYLRDGRNALPDVYSDNVSIANNKIDALIAADGSDYGAGSGMVIMGVKNLNISGNVIVGSKYNGIQLSRVKTMTISGNTVTGTTQPALQIATWNEGTNTISSNIFSTDSAIRGAVRLYGFTYSPTFVFTGNTIQNSKYGIQIGSEKSGDSYNDLTAADYDFTGNTFTGITSHKLLIYINSTAITENTAEMDSLFAQVYGAGSKSRVTTNANPFTYVVVPATVYVDSSFTPSNAGGHVFGADAFSTIQNGINAVATGGTINVAAGEYVEAGQIVIDKNLSIVGADKATTIIKPAQNTGDPNSGDSRGWFLVNSGKTFNLSNVTLDGVDKLVAIGILSYGNGTIENNIIKNIGYNPSTDYYGRGIQLYNTNMTVSDNTLENIGRIGIIGFGPGVTSALIDGNNYTGKGTDNWLDYGIELGGGAVATISNNTITGNTGVASSDGSTSAGILISTYWGVGTQATITDNTVTGNTDGIVVGYDASDTSAVTIHHNNLSGNINTGITSTKPTVDATNNYWGVNLNLESIISGDVDYAPWYVDAEMTTTNIGLASAKTTAHDALTTARALYTDTDYTSDNLATLNEFKTNGDTNIDAALTTDAVTSVQTTAIAGMSGVLKLTAVQTTPDSETGDATLSGDTTQVVLADETQAVTVEIASGTVDPTIDVSAFISLVDGEQTGILPEITINSDVADVVIPGGTTVTGPAGWNGIIDAPTAGTPDGGNAPAGFSVGGTVVSIGSADGTLLFDTAVTIVLPGVTGTVGYRPSGSTQWIVIDTICTGTYDNPTGAIYPGECTITNGTDTKILTFHFTSFGELLATIPVVPITPITPVVTVASAESEAYHDNGSQVGTNSDLGSQATLGSQTTNDKVTDSTANIATISTTDNGWSILGLMWYWWLVIAVAIASAWWIISAVRNRND